MQSVEWGMRNLLIFNKLEITNPHSAFKCWVDTAKYVPFRKVETHKKIYVSYVPMCFKKIYVSYVPMCFQLHER